MHEYLTNKHGLLGIGTFGYVFLKNWPLDTRGNTIKVAVKTVSDDPNAKHLLKREIEFLLSIDQSSKAAQYLPTLFECVMDGDSLYYVMEYFSCTLENFIPHKK